MQAPLVQQFSCLSLPILPLHKAKSFETENAGESVEQRAL